MSNIRLPELPKPEDILPELPELPRTSTDVERKLQNVSDAALGGRAGKFVGKYGKIAVAPLSLVEGAYEGLRAATK